MYQSLKLTTHSVDNSNFTGRRLGELTPLSQIGRIERGENNPTISTLFVLAEALGVELTYLVDVKVKK